MAQLTISEVARTFGLRPSAIRYYEQVGILPEALRTSGQRRYDGSVLRRLAVIQRAQQTGFTLDEIKDSSLDLSPARHPRRCDALDECGKRLLAQEGAKDLRAKATLLNQLSKRKARRHE